MTTIVCPECGKDDMIHKVSAVYDSGFVAVQNNSPLVPYGVVDRTITTITPLAQKLAPPSKPESPRVPPEIGCTTWVLLIGGFIAGMIISSYITDNQFVWVIFGIGTPVTLLFIFDKITKTRFKEYTESRKEDLSQWVEAQQKWSKLYYCSRNDCVFNPDTGKSVSPERISTLIY